MSLTNINLLIYASILLILTIVILPLVFAHGEVESEVNENFPNQLDFGNENLFLRNFLNPKNISWIIGLAIFLLIVYIKRDFKKIIEAIPSFLLGIIFLLHGVEALLNPKSFLSLITIIGFSEPIARILLVIVGLIDIGIFIGLNFKIKKWMLFYTGLWPIIPTILTFAQSGQFETLFIFSIILTLFIYFRDYRKFKFSLK